MWRMRDADELVSVDLTAEQVQLLDRGLVEWGGPARCTDAMAVAMGFTSVQNLFAESERILAELNARRPLSRWDWSRTLIATEIVFASDIMGTGSEWPDTTGLDDVRSFQVLREVQHRLVGALVPIGPRGAS
jgi:hypothetical protein